MILPNAHDSGAIAGQARSHSKPAPTDSADQQERSELCS